MSPIISRAVRFMSSVHGTSTALRAGEKNVDDLARATIFSPQYFPAFLACTMTMSGIAGYQYMGYLRRQNQIHFGLQQP